MAVIECTDVKKTYLSGQVEVPALRGVTLSIEPGEFVALTGPSGCGKTTLLNLIGGLDRPASGDVLVEGRSLNGLSNSELADLRLRRIGFVFQAYNLVPVLSGLETSSSSCSYRAWASPSAADEPPRCWLRWGWPRCRSGVRRNSREGNSNA